MTISRARLYIAGGGLCIGLVVALVYTALSAPVSTAIAQTSPSVAEATLTRREFETRMVELDKRLEQRDALNDRAVQAALASINERLNGMNEFRQTLRDQSTTFVAKAQWDTRNEAIDERLRMLEAANERSIGAARQNTTLIALLGFLMVVVTFGMRFFDKRKEIADRRIP